MNKQKGIYAIYWESEDGMTMISNPNSIDMPREVKVMIADRLLRELNIPIKIERSIDETE